MREIKFRGKACGEWVRGSLIVCEDGHCVINWVDGLRHVSTDIGVAPETVGHPLIIDSVIVDNDIGEPITVDPDTVGQFTGLLDKNGEEIYEGDIVVCVTGRICKVYYFMSPSYCGFDLLPVGGFDCKPPKKSTLWKDLTVIGNVHDNPDLLEKQS